MMVVTGGEEGHVPGNQKILIFVTLRRHKGQVWVMSPRGAQAPGDAETPREILWYLSFILSSANFLCRRFPWMSSLPQECGEVPHFILLELGSVSVASLFRLLQCCQSLSFATVLPVSIGCFKTFRHLSFFPLLRGFEIVLTIYYICPFSQCF